MLRAVWKLPIITYQLLEIPIDFLRLIRTAQPTPAGRRKGRQSLGADVSFEGQCLYQVHFDGSDGKCQVRNLQVSRRVLIDTWDVLAKDLILLTLCGLPKDEPIAVLTPRVMRHLPLGIDDWSLSDLDDAVTGAEAGRAGGLD